MSKYLLLREHQQRGPFSLEELTDMELKPSDLVWVQGRSDSWTPAGEIEELSHLVQTTGNRTSSELQNSNAIPFDSFSRQNPSDPSRENGFDLQTNYSRPFDEIKEMYVHHLQKNKGAGKYKWALLLAATVIIVLSVLLIKKITDKPEVEVKTTQLATPIPAEPVTNTDNFQNALSKEFIPYEAKPKKAKPKDLKKLIGIEQNDFHVRLLGGIKDLKLTVQNYSEHLLDKVEIRVDYLKPKGEVIGSEFVTVTDIKSQESKTVDVPPSARGVKIKYTIVSVESKEYKTVLEEI
jgi:hypothetical protein